MRLNKNDVESQQRRVSDSLGSFRTSNAVALCLCNDWLDQHAEIERLTRDISYYVSEHQGYGLNSDGKQLTDNPYKEQDDINSLESIKYRSWAYGWEQRELQRGLYETLEEQHAEIEKLKAERERGSWRTAEGTVAELERGRRHYRLKKENIKLKAKNKELLQKFIYLEMERERTARDFHDADCEVNRQREEIRLFNEQIEIDKDFINQYQAEVEELHIDLLSAESGGQRPDIALRRIIDACRTAGWTQNRVKYDSHAHDIAGFVEGLSVERRLWENASGAYRKEIEALRKHKHADSYFKKRDSAEIIKLKARLEAAEKVVEEASGFINAFEKSHRQDCRYYFEAPKIEDFLGRPQLYLTADERCDCGYSAYTKVSKEYEKLKAETGEFHCMNVKGMEAFDEVHELKAGKEVTNEKA